MPTYGELVDGILVAVHGASPHALRGDLLRCVSADRADPLLPSTVMDARPVLPEYADLYLGTVASDLSQLDDGGKWLCQKRI